MFQTSDSQKKPLCPRLMDYLVIVGSRRSNHTGGGILLPELLRRYPVDDHRDFPLPPDVVVFCQPEGCVNVNRKRIGLRDTTSFVFTLTEKDAGVTRFGICVNFYRPCDRTKNSISETPSGFSERHSSSASAGSENQIDKSVSKGFKQKNSKGRRSSGACNTLTSLCIISHHPFFSTFRETLLVLYQIIRGCNERHNTKSLNIKGFIRYLILYIFCHDFGTLIFSNYTA